MMNRFFSLMISAALVLSLCACFADTNTIETTTEIPTTQASEVQALAPHPLARQEYVPSEGVTTEELRNIAVALMRDTLSIQWSTEKFIYYHKTDSLSDKKFSHVPGVVFAGIPYTNGSSGLIQWMEFYDSDSGVFSFPGDGQELNGILGNSCSGTIYSAWNAVCNTFTKSGPTHTMVQAGGCLPVGPYTYNPAVDSLKSYSTERICADNGQQIMFDSYAQVLPADALVSTPDVHAVMAIEPAHVEYLEDGSIDGENSYIAIQDQRGGLGDFFYVEKDGDTDIHYSGRLYHEYSFQELWDLSYIPCAPAEFFGTDPYETPEVTFSLDAPETVDAFIKGTVISNYPITVARLMLVDGEGTEVLVDRILLQNGHIPSGKAMNLPLLDFAASLKSDAYTSAIETGKEYTLRVEVVLANGQEYTPGQITFVA